MAQTIIFNSTNATSHSGRFEYVLPATTKFSAEDEVALQSISIYNSVFNVEAQRGNNQITIVWNALVPEQTTLTLADGFYDVNGLNHAIQLECLKRKWYMLDGDEQLDTTKAVYGIELATNPIEYGVLLRAFVLPTAANATTLGYTKPTGATWDFPTSDQTPQLIILTAVFGNLIGFNAGTYPATIQSTRQDITSTKTPQIAPVNSIVIGCNLINSSFSIPNHLFYSIPITTKFGGLINHASSSPIFNKIASGNYSKIVIDLYDQHFSSLRIHDNEVVIVLSIKKKI